jgi:hypothetical protein
MSKDLLVLEIGMLESDYEEGVYDIARGICNTIQKLIIDMKSFVKKLKNDVDVTIAQINKNKRFQELKRLVESPEGKDKKIYFLNVEGAVLLYQRYIRKFSKELDHIIKKSYSIYSDNEQKLFSTKLENFNDELDIFEDELEETLNKKIVKRGEEALQYIESCKRGTDPVYKYYFNLVRSYENFKVDAERRLRKKAIDVETENRKYGNMSKIQVLLQKTSNKTSRGARRIMYKVLWWSM